jgi:hypothetical protein
MKRLRTADPYRDTDVIDARAPRFNQAVIGSLSLEDWERSPDVAGKNAVAVVPTAFAVGADGVVTARLAR